MRTPTWCRTTAGKVGPGATAVIDGLLEVNALYRLRAAQGVLGLATKHGNDRLEAACATATAVGDPSYRTIKGILAAGTENAVGNRAGDPNNASAVPAFLRGPDQLFAAEPDQLSLFGTEPDQLGDPDVPAPTTTSTAPNAATTNAATTNAATTNADGTPDTCRGAGG